MYALLQQYGVTGFLLVAAIVAVRVMKDLQVQTAGIMLMGALCSIFLSLQVDVRTPDVFVALAMVLLVISLLITGILDVVWMTACTAERNWPGMALGLVGVITAFWTGISFFATMA